AGRFQVGQAARLDLAQVGTLLDSDVAVPGDDRGGLDAAHQAAAHSAVEGRAGEFAGGVLRLESALGVQRHRLRLEGFAGVVEVIDLRVPHQYDAPPRGADPGR